MRIAMVSPYSVSVPGGVQAQVLGLARELRRVGHEVRVLAPCDGPPPEPFVTPLGNSLPTAANGSVAPLAPDPSAALRTIRALNDEAFDVIHLHEPIVPGPTVTALLLKLAPTVGTFHAAGDSTSYRVLNKTARWAAEHLNVRVAVSESAKELAHRYLDGEYTVLFNGIEVQRYERPSVVREKTPTIFFCGRYEPRKGLEVLLQAMAHMPADVKLWIASDGIGIDDLQNTYGADTRINWLGRITEEDKLDRLARCTAFCAPSLRGESFGIVLLEAMAAGAALVASNISGYNNVATQEVNALLVEPGNPVALAKALQVVMTDDEVRQRLVQGGHERAHDFSMERLAQSYIQIYERLLHEETERLLHIEPNRFVAMFGDRVLRRPKFLNGRHSD
ncbi:MAG: glycosyltransferase family 1 protein [Actinobacteria bacterium]|nr:glycosyltransferase family 1 protein [Actinomycetota bacterium]